MKIYNVNDDAFRSYGKVIKDIDFTELLEAMEKTPLTDGVEYQPSVEVLEATSLMEKMQTVYYGELPIQIGFCNGYNHLLNALEYHRSSEVNVAATDLILLLGKQQDITDDFTYDTSKVEAFLCPKGTAIEVYATTLHYAPCSVDGAPFKCVVVLPKDTNLELDAAHQGGEDGHLTAKNKWLLGHPEGGLPEGSPMGLVGENLSV